MPPPLRMTFASLSSLLLLLTGLGGLSPALADGRFQVAFRSPSQGAVVWGAIGLSADQVMPPAAWNEDRGERAIRLVLPDGSHQPPVRWSQPQEGPRRHYSFQIDTTDWSTGWHRLVVEALDDDGQVTSHDHREIFVFRPDAATVLSGEAEALRETERAPRYQNNRELTIRDSEQASGGAFVANNGPNPPVTLDVDVQDAGWYQLILTVGGESAASVLPTVGMRVGNNFRPTTAAAIADTAWHRAPIGRPFRLPTGEQKLTFYYENDTNFGRGQDRNLWIDRYELVRLPADIGQAAHERGRLGVAFMSMLHGQKVAGEVAIEGYVHQPNSELEAPRVVLQVNGESAAEQHGERVRFVVGREWLRDGENTVQLQAIDRFGQQVTSSLFSLQLAPAPDQAPDLTDRRPRLVRLNASQPGWQRQGPRLQRDRGHGQEPVLAFLSNGQARIALDDALQGEYAVFVHARGDQFDGAPSARVTLIQGEERSVVGETTVPAATYYGDRRVGTLHLPAGPKALEVAFTNDAHNPDTKQDRNLHVRRIELRRIDPRDTLAPTGIVRYPADGQALHKADAVVVDTTDDHRLAHAQLLLNGEPVGGRIEPHLGQARMLLPLVLRRVEPGDHQLAVRLTDPAGNRTDLPARRITVLPADQPQAVPGPYERAVRVLNRFAFGPEPQELAEVLVQGEAAWLEKALAMPMDDPGWVEAWRLASLRRPLDHSESHVPQRAANFLLNSPNPAAARLVMFIDNHFNTWQRKVRPERKAAEFARWIEHGPGSFRQLLHLSATSPSMLIYLDQQRSFARRINENYAREIMELHTLGVHGGYSQEDVTRLAHLLAGWTTTPAARPDGDGNAMADLWSFVPNRSDAAAQKVIDRDFPKSEPIASGHTRIFAALDLLAEHPATAAFVCRKLAEHYLILPQDDAEALTERLASTFTESHGDLRQVVAALLADPLYAQVAPQPRFSHPLAFALRIQRLCGDLEGDSRTLTFTRGSGAGIFDRETPDGFPEEDEAYADSNAMLQRWNFARQLEYRFFTLLPASLRNLPRQADDAQIIEQLHHCIDELAVRLTGRLLSDRSREAVLMALGDPQLNPNQALRLAGTLIAQMPESSLR